MIVRRALATLTLGLTLALGAVACGSDDSSSSSSTSTSTGTSTATQCATPCDNGCPNIVCSCKDGTPVNTTSCSNNCCETKDVACPGSCKDHGGWGG